MSFVARHVEKPFVSSTSEARAGRAPSEENRRNAGSSDGNLNDEGGYDEGEAAELPMKGFRNHIVSCLCKITGRKGEEKGEGSKDPAIHRVSKRDDWVE
jgi:hypothetical protein